MPNNDTLEDAIKVFDSEKSPSDRVGDTFVSGEIKLIWKVNSKGIPQTHIVAKEVTKSSDGQTLTRQDKAVHNILADEPERNKMVRDAILKEVELFLENGTIL